YFTTPLRTLCNAFSRFSFAAHCYKAAGDTMIRQTVAALYHQQTKYHPATIAQGHFWDRENPPPQFKEYAGAERIELKPFLPTEENPSWQAEAALRDPNGTFGLPTLSRLLFATNGVT